MKIGHKDILKKVQFEKLKIQNNYKINGIYFDENCYVRDGVAYEINPQTELMLDHLILDWHEKKIKNRIEYDGFIKAFEEEIKGKKLQVVINETKNKCLLADGVQILELEKGKIVSLNFPSVTKIRDSFLFYNTQLRELSMPNVRDVGWGFLGSNTQLRELNMPNVRKIGHLFLYNNRELQKLSMPKLKEYGFYFLRNHPNRKQLLSQKNTMPTMISMKRTMVMVRDRKVQTIQI